MSTSTTQAGGANVYEGHHLQKWIINISGWVDDGDKLGFTVDVAHGEVYKVSKKILDQESKYFRACFTSSHDPYPIATARLCSLDELPAFVFILSWFNESVHIPAWAGRAADEQPEMSVQDWYQKYRKISFENWSKIIVLAEFLHIPRLESHIRVAVYQKALDLNILPTMAAVKYVYEEGKIFCGLKGIFVDMFAIAAMKPTPVFGGDREKFPGAFVDEVEHYSKSAAYIHRRYKLAELRRLPENMVAEELDDDEDEDEDED